MNIRCLLTVIAAGAGAAACTDARPTGPENAEGEADIALSAASGGPDRATGGGHFDAGVDVTFSFNAIRQGAGMDATGNLRFSTELGGLQIQFQGRTTCLAVDLDEGRAWIGGVITQNDSEHPAFTEEIHDPGHDIWFRVLDSGEGGGAAADRTTFVGFEGGAGIGTSAEYCELQIWPDDNARTSPVTSGNIQVR